MNLASVALTLDIAIRMREHIWRSLEEAKRMDHTRHYSTRVVCFRDVAHVPHGELWMDGGDRDEFKLMLK